MAATWMHAGLGSRGRRLVAAGVAIVIGTAFLAASLAFLATARAGLEDAVAAGVRDADLVVTSGGRLLDHAAYDAVSRTDGVAKVDVEAWASATWKGEDLSGTALPINGLPVLSGRLPKAPGEIAVNALARDRGAQVGSALTVTALPSGDGTPPEPLELTVVGVVDPGSMNGLSYGPGFATTEPTLRLVDPQLAYNSILIQLAPGADSTTVTSAVMEAVPDAVVTTGAMAARQRVNGFTGDTDVFGSLLLGFGAVALLTAAMVIANTFTITVAQRTHELALMRCVGATTRQVRRLVLFEALLLGVLASAAGVLVGLGVAAGLLGYASSSLARMPLANSLQITPTAILMPFAIGLLVTVAAALLPARRATQVSPLAALRPVGDAVPRRSVALRRVAIAALLFAVGTALMLLAATRRDVLAGVAGGLLSFVGVLAASSVIVPAIARLFGGLLRPAGVPGRLAVDNAVRNPGRAAATSAALLVGVTLITMTTIGAATGERTALGEIDNAYAVDFAAIAPPTDSAGSPMSGSISPAVAADLGKVKGVAASAPVDTAYLTLGEQSYPTLALGLDQTDAGVIRSSERLAALTPGTIGLGNLLQEINGLPPGERVTVSGPGGSKELTVVEFGLGDAVALNPAEVRQLGGSSVRSGAVLVRTRDGADLGKVLSGLQSAGDADHLNVVGSAVDRAIITRALDVLVLVASALLGVAVLIALVGIANTLSLSVIERHREHALLRGMGLTRSQMRLMLLVEGALLALVSALIGLALGLLYARLGVQTILPADTPVRLGIPYARLGLIVAVAVAAGLLASVLPARRAARVTPAEGLATA